MAKDWRCLIGRHEWRVVEVKKPDRDRSQSALDVESATGFAPSLAKSGLSGVAPILVQAVVGFHRATVR